MKYDVNATCHTAYKIQGLSVKRRATSKEQQQLLLFTFNHSVSIFIHRCNKINARPIYSFIVIFSSLPFLTFHRIKTDQKCHALRMLDIHFIFYLFSFILNE